jgi:serine/threonine-protein kinase
MTDPASWRRIELILDELLDLDPAEQRTRLDALVGQDAGLRAHIERLLEADSQGERGILDGGLAPLASRVLDDLEPPIAAIGQRFGPYRVVRELGRGGMGEVLLAERASGDFEQLVALKIIRAGLDRSDIVDRFRHERRVLARLRHANIAALYDGGATADGVPYFAMEYVEGQRIHDYCDAKLLTVDQRIDLFDSVCRAVQHAHRNLVVHRDLKPSNVLVTPEGTVKLLDFGIAKLVDAEGEASDNTQRTGPFLTPAFAAPEQILGEPTSTATDVYALGVLLYLLLTGHNPHGETARSIDLAKAILEGEAPDPSKAVGRDTGTGTSIEIARRRRTEPAALRRRLRGDLENILRKALQKKPEDRYASVEDLRADLERHRRSLPVVARVATPGYRIRKFVHRHRIGVVAAIATAAALTAGVVGIAWQARVAARARDVAEKARDDSERARSESDAVTRFLTDMLSAADPRERGRDVTVREVLDEGANTIGERFVDQPLVRARLMVTMGNVFHRLGLDNEGRPLVEEGLALRRTTLGEMHPDVAYAENSLAINLHASGDFAGARTHYERALAIWERTQGPEHPNVAQVLNNLANTLWVSGDFAAARPLMERALAIREKVRGPDHLDVAQTLNNLGALLSVLGDTLSSRKMYERALVIREAKLGPDHPDVAQTLYNLALNFVAANDHRGAIPHLERALRSQEQALGPSHPEAALTMSSLGGSLAKVGDVANGRRYLHRALAIQESALATDHPDIASTLAAMGEILIGEGDYEAARPILERAVSINDKHLATDHPDALVALEALAKTSRHLGDASRAAAIESRAAAIRRKSENGQGAVGAR